MFEHLSSGKDRPTVGFFKISFESLDMCFVDDLAHIGAGCSVRTVQDVQLCLQNVQKLVFDASVDIHMVACQACLPAVHEFSRQDSPGRAK